MEVQNIQLDALVISKLFKPDSDFGQLIGVESDSVITITNTTPGDNQDILEHLDQLNYENNVIGLYSSDLKSLFEILMQKPDTFVGIFVQDGKLTAYKLSTKQQFTKIPITVKNTGLMDAFLTTVDEPPVKLTNSSIRNTLDQLLTLSDHLNQDKNHYKTMKKNPNSEHQFVTELMHQLCAE